MNTLCTNIMLIIKINIKRFFTDGDSFICYFLNLNVTINLD